MDLDTCHPLAKHKAKGNYSLKVISPGIHVRNFHDAFPLNSHQHFKVGNDWFQTHEGNIWCSVVRLYWKPERASTSERERWRTEWSQLSCTLQQDGEPTSAPIDNLHKLLGPEGVIAALNEPTVLAALHSTHTLNVSHWNTATSVWYAVRLYLSDVQKRLFFFYERLNRSQHLSTSMTYWYSEYWLPCFGWSSRHKNLWDPSSWWRDESLWSPGWRKKHLLSSNLWIRAARHLH